MMRPARTARYNLSVDPTQGSLRRAVMAWLGLVLLAFNVLGAGAMPARADATAFRDGLGGRMVVCTAGGLSIVDTDAGTTAMVDGLSCVFCLPLMHGAVAAPALAAVATAPALADVGFTPAQDAPLPPARQPGAASPRAPPLA